MSTEVVFENEDVSNNKVANIQIVSGAPTGMLAWLVKNKVTKDAKQAEQLLLVVAIIAAILGVGIFVAGSVNQSRHFSAVQLQSITGLKAQDESNSNQ